MGRASGEPEKMGAGAHGARRPVAQGHAIEGAAATPWNTEGVPGTGTAQRMRCADCSFSRQISSTSSVSVAMISRSFVVQGLV